MRATTRSGANSTHSIPSLSASPVRMCSLARRAASFGEAPASMSVEGSEAAIAAKTRAERSFGCSDAGADQDHLRGEPEQEPDEDPPQTDLPRQTAPGVEQLADHIQDRARGEREERDED